MATLNMTSSSSSRALDDISVIKQIVISILVIALVLGFPGNLFVVWTVLWRVGQRSVTCLLVLNLAVADACVLLSAPLFLRQMTSPQGWEFGEAMCKTVHYLCGVNMYVSIYLICLMSMDRWMAVTRPLLSQRLRNKKTIYLAMLCIWVMAFLLALPVPIYRRVKTTEENETFCYTHHQTKQHTNFYYLFETLMGFVVPFTFILAFYTSVILRLRSAMFRGRVKGSFLILMIIITFTIFWLPYHLINIIEVFGSQKMMSARYIVIAFAYLSSSVNPILYVFAGSSHIRQAGLSFMAKLFEATHSDQNSITRRFTSTDNSTLKSLRSVDKIRNKSCGEEERKEELKTLAD